MYAVSLSAKGDSMSTLTEAILVFYSMLALGVAVTRCLGWHDTNILRLILVGVGWPVVVLWYGYRASLAIGRYLRGRLWVELAELTDNREKSRQ